MMQQQFINGTFDPSTGVFYPAPFQVSAPNHPSGPIPQERHVEHPQVAQRKPTRATGAVNTRIPAERTARPQLSEEERRAKWKHSEYTAFIKTMCPLVADALANANLDEGEVVNIWSQLTRDHMRQFWHYVKEDEAAVSHWNEFDLPLPMAEVHSMIPAGYKLTLIDTPQRDQSGKIYRKFLLHAEDKEVY